MRSFLFLILIFFSSYTFGQSPKSVELNWKINLGDTIQYQLMVKNRDSISVSTPMQWNTSQVEELKAVFPEFDSIEPIKQADDVILSKRKAKIIDILVKTPPPTQTGKGSQTKKQSYSTRGSYVMRGAVYETGDIYSFWVRQPKKLLLAYLFQLPTRPVKIGDSWQIDAYFLATGTNFICDSAYKNNQVTLVDLKQVNGETIAILKYNLEEYIAGTEEGTFNKGAMHYDYTNLQAVAEFSVNQGRWLNYQAIIRTFFDNSIYQRHSNIYLSLIPES